MSEIVPDDGKEWLSDRVADGVDPPNAVAVGIGTAEVSSGDQSLDDEEYRATVDQSNASVSSVDGEPELRAQISVAGGTEVDPGTEISELGLFTEDGIMAYREVRDEPEVIDDGQRVSFDFRIEFQ